jgi:hypothetical protein
MMLYLSRAFVEFGPFSAEELSSFHQRGILKETDYVRSEGAEEWLHIEDWAASLAQPPVTKAEPPAKKPVAKKAKAAAEAPKPSKTPAKKAKKAA